MALLKDLIVQGASRFVGDAYFNNIKSGTWQGSPIGIAYGGTGATTAAGARANLGTWSLVSDSYNTLMPADGSTNGWIKIGTSNTSYGLLPSASGSAGSGHNYIGTSSWYWKYAYIDEVHGTLHGSILGGAKGSIPYLSAANTTTFLGIGTAGLVLKVGSSGVPEWGSDSNSDTRVTQTVTTSSNSSWRPVIVGYSSSDASTFTPVTTTDTVYATHLVKLAPAYGKLALVGLNKMNTDGTVATGSNDVVFNTNGTTTTLGSNAYTSTPYVPIAGGTMTGALTTPSLTVTGASSFSQAINGSILGNAATASRWQNARTLTLTGAVTGSVSIDGSANVSLTTTVNHNHDDRYYTETESDSRYLKLAGGWMDTDAQIGFKGYNSSTSVYAGIAYLASVGGNRYHLGSDTYNTKGLYIYTNGYNASNDWGGLAIDNDGVTAFGAGDTGAVFRVINEDNAAQGAQFAVLKENGAYVRNNLTVGTQSVDTNSKLAVIGNVRITNSASNTGCKMEYNATEECLEFNF